MSHTEHPNNTPPEMPREIFQSVVQQPIEVEQFLKKELMVCFYDVDGKHEFKTCYGDLCKSVNALMDYARILRMACEQWNLTGYHKAVYEYHAEQMVKIAGRFGTAIGYDYAAAIEKCRKKRGQGHPKSDVGDDALTQMYRRSLQNSKEKQESSKKADSSEQTNVPPVYPVVDKQIPNSSPWEDD